MLSGLRLASSLMAKSGMPSGLEAFPDEILLASILTSSSITSGNAAWPSVSCHVIFCCYGNKVSIMLSSLSGSDNPGMDLLPNSFLVTNLYGRPQGSASTCSQNLFQQLFLPSSILILSALQASLYSVYSTFNCSGSFLHLLPFNRLLATWHFFFDSSISFDHQNVGFLPPL